MLARPAVAAVLGIAIAVPLAAAPVGAEAIRGAAPSPALLKPNGIGSIEFGLAKKQAVVELSRFFGPPSAAGLNTACGRRYAEVVWGDLAAEFRGSVFSGYRYIKSGYPLTTPESPRETRPLTVTPRLATTHGVTLGSTLAQVRVAYGGLRRIGADMWKAGGLSFTDNAARDPVSPSSRIIEIKSGTCGDF